MELKAIVHQITDSDGLVWQEKERVDIVYAMAQMSSRIPDTTKISPHETKAALKKPKNARIAEIKQNIEIQRFPPLTAMKVNHVGCKSKMWVDPRS